MPYIIIKKTARELAAMAQTRQGPLAGRLSAVVRNAEDASELARTLGGRDVKARRPVMVDVGGTRKLIVGDGEATAAELADLAAKAVEASEPDFDKLRERGGQMRREEVPAAMRNAMLDRIARHRANPVTDPERQPDYRGRYTKRYFI